ncbi:MAG: amidohydrolase family protein [Pseudomonadota bacterium]
MRIRRWLLRTGLAIGVVALTVTAIVTLWPPADLPGPVAEGIVDWHAHTAGIGAGGSGIVLSPVLRDSYKYPFYLSAFHVSETEIQTHGDAIVVKRISELVGASKRVSKAVVLAMDGVVDQSGKLDRARTQVLIPNEFVRETTQTYPHLLYGASVHPRRPDALSQLRRAKADGAVVVKWIPGIMDIDPADPAYIPYYQTLRCLGLPLISHTGDERSFGPSDDRLGDPLRLALPLEHGVTVIAAHMAVSGSRDGERNLLRVIRLMKTYENLFADISAMTLFNRGARLQESLMHPTVRSRLIYGSDWPLQFFPLVSPWYESLRLSLADIQAVSQIENPWDRDVAIKQALGVDAEVFARSPLAFAEQRRRCG